MTPAFYFIFSAVQIVGGLLALRWLSRVPVTSKAVKVSRIVGQVSMVLMIIAAVAVGVVEIIVLNAPAPQPLQSA
jgi:hypothetical protein